MKKSSINRQEPLIKVGVLLNQKSIDFNFLGTYYFQEKEYKPKGCTVEFVGGKLLFEGQEYDEIVFEATDIHKSSFELKDVIIGVNFHWERRENQRFLGSLRLIVEKGGVSAINVVSLEDYLTSVISSEMSATSSEELLKAHSVISRSWLLAQIQKSKRISTNYQTLFKTENELIRWYDREDHSNFDVCADDHCQRYQGITKQSTELVKEVVKQTRGEVLMSENEICDARFSKCCGGVMETFENVWESIKHPYLQAKRDAETTIFPNLSVEENTEKWIRTSPDAFCNTQNQEVLKQVLNDYDQETADFYRWKISYTQKELSALIKENMQLDFGEIIDLLPLQRGFSGRLIKLKIVGTKRTMTIGKELEIRKVLSTSHLYSSAFVIDKINIVNDIPQNFTFIGAGWGHGVGLCQIGAAMMAVKGYPYKMILSHYFPTSNLIKYY